MKRTVLAVVVIVIAAAGAWWWRSGGAAARRAAGIAAPARGDRATLRDPARRDAPSAPRPRRMIDDDPDGALRLEGQVVDASAHGVAGATVSIGATPPRTVVTEDDGTFAFDHLIGRAYVLTARTADAAAGPVIARLSERSDPVVLRLRPASTVRVAVVGGDGAPVEGATVELRGNDEQRATLHGKAAVFTAVVPGAYQVAAWADGMARAFQRIQVGVGDTEARLVLGAGAAVTGRVVDDRGNGVPGAEIRYSGASDWTQQADARRDGAISQADGSFRFDALPAGSFRFIAIHRERAPGTSPLVTLDGRTERSGVVIAMPIGAAVRGRVFDTDHRPVASAKVRLDDAAPDVAGTAYDAPRDAYSDAQGGFEFTGVPRKQLSVVAHHEIGGSMPVPVDTTAGDVDNLSITLDITGAIAGVVVDPLGQPVEGAQVGASPALIREGKGVPRYRDIPDERTDAAGRFTLRGFGPGKYRISAAPPNRARSRGDLRNGVIVESGDTSVRVVVTPDGGVQGRVAYGDGTAPALFTLSADPIHQSFVGGDGRFALDGLAPGHYQLEVRGPIFQTRTVEIDIAASNTTDAGTITVIKGRSIAGLVVADGRPVAGATVYVGNALFGSGSTSGSPSATAPPRAMVGDGARTTTSDAAGRFSIFGLPGGDVTLVAEQDAVGRSRAVRLPELMPGQTELTIALQAFGALRGTLRQSGAGVPGTVVTCTSTSSPGAVYRVATGADGAYRFDRLAPDVYKVSATLRAGRFGARLYSQQATVESGQEATADLDIAPGKISLNVAAVSGAGPIGAASLWLVSGAVTARTMTELTLKLAAAGPGTSARLGMADGEIKQFTELSPGAYSVCVTPLPREVTGAGTLDYATRHGDTLATFCSPVTIAPSPDTQSVRLTVEVPPFVPDRTAGATGSDSPSSGG